MAVVIEVNPESLRDLAGAIHAAANKDPSSEMFDRLERQVLGAVQNHERHLVLSSQDAVAVEAALRRRAFDQRSSAEGFDYEQLADRIALAIGDDLATSEIPLTDELPAQVSHSADHGSDDVR